MQKKISTLAGIITIIFVAVILVGGVFVYQQNQTQQNQIACTMEAKICPDGSAVGRSGPKCEFALCPDYTVGWKTYTNTQLGLSFKYPATLNSKYAQFNSVSAISDAININSKGCFVPQQFKGTEIGVSAGSGVVINGVSYCFSSFGDPGAGQLYTSYEYTQQKDGKYYTLEYVVHTPNGCSPYMGTPDYQPCTDFLSNQETTIVKVIQESVATLKLINQ